MKGIYCLMIKVRNTTTITIGALGNTTFDKGIYCYVGSAQNSIESRISRHKSKGKKFRWHIDYFLDNENVSITDVYYKEVGREEECSLARYLLKTELPINRFGCSDCKCKAHLFRVQSVADFGKLGLTKLN